MFKSSSLPLIYTPHSIRSSHYIPKCKSRCLLIIVFDKYIIFNHWYYRFLEASAHLYSKLPLPTVDEVADYEFRLRVEAEERGEEIEEDVDDNGDYNNNDNDNNDDQKREVPANDDGAVCKVAAKFVLTDKLIWHHCRVDIWSCAHPVQIESCWIPKICGKTVKNRLSK